MFSVVAIQLFGGCQNWERDQKHPDALCLHAEYRRKRQQKYRERETKLHKIGRSRARDPL